MQSPESGPWNEFTAPNSLREVEVGSNLLLRVEDPSDDPTADYPDPPPDDGSTDDVPVVAEDADVEDADVVLDELAAT
ncbi:MAG: hypothetical protein R2755_23505 [Acidimicrobiales bacterium]